MCMGAGGVAWLSEDNGLSWQVVPNGLTIVSTMATFVDRARPNWGWQTIQDLDADFYSRTSPWPTRTGG